MEKARAGTLTENGIYQAFLIAYLESLANFRGRAWFALGIFADIAGSLGMALNYFFLTLVFGRPNAHDLGSQTVVAFIMSGLAMKSLIRVAEGRPVSVVQRSYSDGFLRRAIIANSSTYAVVIGRVLPDFWRGCTSALVYLFLGLAFFSLHVRWTGVFWGVCILGLGVLATLGLGLCLTWLFFASSVLRSFGQSIASLISLAFGTLCGVVYPIAVLPPAVRCVALLLPQTHCYRAVRLVVVTGSLAGTWADVRFMLIFAMVSIPIGLWVVKRGMDKVRRQGYAPRTPSLFIW